MFKKRLIQLVAAFCAASITMESSALEPEAGALFVRVVDTGAAECVVIMTDNQSAIVYDCGHWNANGFRAWKGVNDLFYVGHEVALMVLSHSDSDHNGGAARILGDYQVNEVVHSGVVRDSATSENTLEAIAAEPDCINVDLGESDLPNGTRTYGQTWLSFLCGWNSPPSDWPLVSDGERGATCPS